MNDHTSKTRIISKYVHQKQVSNNTIAYDIEYNFPFGWGEVEGIHNRTDFDLKQHENLSGKNMTYFDTKAQDKYHPYIIEHPCSIEPKPVTKEKSTQTIHQQ